MTGDSSDKRPHQRTSQSPRAIVFAGGGTGGHIFPAIAIHQAILARCQATNQPSPCVKYLCSSRSVDHRILTDERLDFSALPAQPIYLHPIKLARFMFSWPKSLRQARAHLQELKRSSSAVHVVAMGGFVAAPVVQAARVEKVPVTLVNLDAAPGRANRWIAKHARTGLTTVPAEQFPNWQLVRPIVRQDARATKPRATCRSELGLDPALNVLMITGGSLGAESINDLLAELVRSRPHVFRGWQIIHQCGPKHVSSLRQIYDLAKIRATVVDLTRQIGLWWGAADLCISRAGAGSVAEAWCNRVPTVFLPYPYHADNHQAHNAQAMVNAGAATLVKDLISPQANLASAGELITRLLIEPDTLKPLAQAASNLPDADGAATIAEHLLAADKM